MQKHILVAVIHKIFRHSLHEKYSLLSTVDVAGFQSMDQLLSIDSTFNIL